KPGHHLLPHSGRECQAPSDGENGQNPHHQRRNDQHRCGAEPKHDCQAQTQFAGEHRAPNPCDQPLASADFGKGPTGFVARPSQRVLARHEEPAEVVHQRAGVKSRETKHATPNAPVTNDSRTSKSLGLPPSASAPASTTMPSSTMTAMGSIRRCRSSPQALSPSGKRVARTNAAYSEREI